MTAARQLSYSPLHGVRGQKAVIVPVRFSPNGAGQPTLTADQKQAGVTSVVWSATGNYAITLDSKYSALLGYDLQVKTATGTHAYAAMEGAIALAPSSTGATFTVITYTAATTTAVDLAAHADNQVFLTLLLSTSGLTTT